MEKVVRLIRHITYHIKEFLRFCFILLIDHRCLVPVIVIFSVFYPASINIYEFPTYRVVLDPGHGGIAKRPISIHGDRYDSISGCYLDIFKEGAARNDVKESRIVYSIARKVERILTNCSPEGDNEKFYRLLSKYSDTIPERINIVASLSRGRSLTEEEAENMEDPNGPFRLFDYPDEDGTIQPGRISRINSRKPHLVVSLHLAGAAPREYEGMNPVLTVPYSMLRNGLLYLRGERKEKDFFYDSPYRDWFVESVRRTEFEWFLNDASLYFTSFPIEKDGSVKKDNFKGYRYNMVSWAYADNSCWESVARYHLTSTRYSNDYHDFIDEGKFWAREKSKYEDYRRGGGLEGFGGDNAYASYELIRYMLYSLKEHGSYNKRHVPGKSYFSVWILPLHVNAINAFIELGYLNRRRDRYILTRKQNEIAEGIAVGIYSLFAGLELKDDKFKYRPLGKKIDLEKYRVSSEKSYFEAVVDD